VQSLEEKAANRTFENAALLKYLGRTATNLNSIQEEIRGGRIPVMLASMRRRTRLLSKNVKIRIYKTIILPVVLYGCETWSLTFREEQGVEEDIWAEEG
jgi:hypothetical protein